MRKLFGTDGIRGVYQVDLTESMAYKLGFILGKKYRGGKFLIVRDTRESGMAIEEAICEGLLKNDVVVLRGGILPTPAAALVTRIEGCFGVVISASHNPYFYNGIKLLKSGYKLSDEEEIEIERDFENEKELNKTRCGKVMNFAEALDIYVNAIYDMFKDIDFSGLKVAVDAANGAAYRTTPIVLNKLGVKVSCFADQPDGRNINQGCGSLYPSFLKENINDFDLGILHDGDADRCIFLTRNGKEIHGDKTMGVLADWMKQESRLKNDIVVATVMSNLGLEIFLSQRGIKLIRTKVGDRYVLEQMISLEANLGGERSGHIIFLDRSTTGDGLITAIEFLRVMVLSGKDPCYLESMVIDYPQHMINVDVTDKSVAEHPKLKEKIDQFQNDGYRIIVRPSGTERLIRVMVEGKDESSVKSVAEELAEFVKTMSFLGEGESV